MVRKAVSRAKKVAKKVQRKKPVSRGADFVVRASDLGLDLVGKDSKAGRALSRVRSDARAVGKAGRQVGLGRRRAPAMRFRMIA